MLEAVDKIIAEGYLVLKSRIPSGHKMLIDRVDSIMYQKWIMNCISFLDKGFPVHSRQIRALYNPDFNLVPRVEQIIGILMSARDIIVNKKKDDFDSKIAQSDMEYKMNIASLHNTIFEACKELFDKGHYSEAAEKSFKVVKDRLRELTGFERASDAFGKGQLFVFGASAENVEIDFNNGAKFLMMAIDMFRNVKGHTSKAKIADPILGYEYLRLSSLAMHLLDTVEIRKKES